MHIPYVLLAQATTSSLSPTDYMDLVTKPISIVISAITLVIVVLGYTIIKDVRSRSLDSLFSFLAQLKAHLELLRATLGTEPRDENDINNVFYYLCFTNRKCTDNGSKIDMEAFIKCAGRLTELMASAKGQIPVTEKMADNLDFIMKDLISYSAYPFNDELAASEIHEKYKAMVRQINEVILAIQVSRKEHLKRIWKKTQKQVDKHERNHPPR